VTAGQVADNIDITLVCPGIVVSDFLKNRAAGNRVADPPGMSTERCATLMLAGIANGLSEIWVAQQPMLVFI
jgi:short-subunit dehydrogenase